MQLHPDKIISARILIAALDWGMGHTTRCVSIIRQLITQKNEIIFAGNLDQCAFIKREFEDQVKFVHLDGYGVTLDSQKSAYWQLLNQFSKIKKAIDAENKFVQKFVKEHKIELVISDNRYGFFSAQTNNIFISHQLNLQLPFLKRFVNSQLKKWIEKFDGVWIPDDEKKSLCGDLVLVDFVTPKIFIGLLGRFRKQEIPVRFDFLGIVSGPEPERTRFSKLLADYLCKQNKRVALVGAKEIYNDISCFENPSTQELQHLINESACVISRAGYTTIMELILLEKNAILIPTPGQFEQEYLAKNVQSEFLSFISEKDLTQSIPAKFNSGQTRN
jgi:hypothetical protein